MIASTVLASLLFDHLKIFTINLDATNFQSRGQLVICRKVSMLCLRMMLKYDGDGDDYNGLHSLIESAIGYTWV